MAWIPWVEEEAASGIVAAMYQEARSKFGFVPDAVKIHSIRPDVAAPLFRFKDAVLGEASTIGARRADMLATAVAGMNHCEYCGTAHAGMLALRDDLDAGDAVKLFKDWRSADLDDAERTMIEFAEKLTFQPSAMEESDVERLREVGFDEVQIYDIVMLTAYRNFINRVHDGLGVPVARLSDRFAAVYADIVS